MPTLADGGHLTGSPELFLLFFDTYGRWCARSANNHKPSHCYHCYILTTSVLVYPSLYLSSYPTFGYTGGSCQVWSNRITSGKMIRARTRSSFP
jgi:hypothetical protein